MVKVSVIVPVYNVEDYLSKCLDSLVNQTLKDIEIIVVNDGSPDNSQDIINEYALKYPKIIKSFKKKNGGLSSARNYGIKKATGEYIAFVDSDDWLELYGLEHLYNKAVSDDLDIVVFDSLMVYDNRSDIYLNARFNLSDIDYIDYMISPPMACNKLYKRSLFTKDYFFKNGIFYEDLELIPSFVIKTKKIGYLNEDLYKYYQRTGSIMYQTTFNEKLLDIFTVLDSLENKFISSKLDKEYQEELEYLYIEHLLYSASLRFSIYDDGKKYIKQINEIINNKYKNWKSNKYYKKRGLKFKTICFLTRTGNVYLLKKLYQFKNKKEN